MSVGPVLGGTPKGEWDITRAHPRSHECCDVYAKETQWVKGIIGAFIVKDRGSLGPRDTDLKDIGILHRTVKCFGLGNADGERTTYEVDPRHAVIWRQQCGFAGGAREGSGDAWRTRDGEARLVDTAALS